MYPFSKHSPPTATKYSDCRTDVNDLNGSGHETLTPHATEPMIWYVEMSSLTRAPVK